MGDGESLKVNPETLELLQNRLESKVRASFFRGVTIPIGGGGLVGILAAVLWWIPDQVENILQQESVQKEIHAKIQASVDGFFELEDTQRDMARRIQDQVGVNLEQKLPDLVDRSVREEVEDYFASGRGREDVRRFFDSSEGRTAMRSNISDAVKEFLSSDAGAQALRGPIGESVAVFFTQADGITLVGEALPEAVTAQFETDPMRVQIQELVDEFLGGEGKDALIEAVNEKLRPAVERTSQAVKQNASELVEELFARNPDDLDPGTPLVESEKVGRPSVSELARLRREGKPVVLTLNLRSPLTYNQGAIQDHLDAFRSELGELFRFVAVLHGDGQDNRLVALLKPGDFQARLEADPEKVLDGLNDRESSPEDGREWARTNLGPSTHVAVDWDRPLLEVLTDAELWSSWRELDAELAVVDSGEHLVAATSRRRLIEGMLR